MRQQMLVVGALAMAVWCAASIPAAAQREFQFFAQFVDATGKPVTTLTEADIQVSEDGTNGKVVKLEPVNWPVRVAILLDNGIGSADRIVNVRTGAKGLIEALPEGVEISLHTLAPQPRVLVRPTTDRKSLVEGVDRYSPDSGASRFIEGLIEAVARFDKEKANTFPVVIILGSLTAEGSSIRDRDVKQLFERLQSRAITVHAVLAGASTVSTGGTVALATQIALAATKQTGGRYESIAAATRLATLLPEIGAQVARSHARQSAQYRVTFERPAGKSGNIGQIGLAARSGVTVNLTLDGRLP
jgi:hypothetical protein